MKTMKSRYREVAKSFCDPAVVGDWGVEAVAHWVEFFSTINDYQDPEDILIIQNYLNKLGGATNGKNTH